MSIAGRVEVMSAASWVPPPRVDVLPATLLIRSRQFTPYEALIMYRSTLLIAVTLTTVHSFPASAQQPRFDLAQPEHSLLERFAGEWQFERRDVPADGSDARILAAGVISAEMVGDFFVVGRWTGSLYGIDYNAVHSLGYDIEQKAYTGYWIDSFMSYRWQVTGFVDDESQELTLTTSGPAPTGGTTAFRERYRFDSADSMTIIGEMQRGDGWVALSTTRLTRRH